MESKSRHFVAFHVRSGHGEDGDGDGGPEERRGYREFFKLFLSREQHIPTKLPPLPDIPMNDGMVSPAKMSVEGSSRQRRNILEAKIGIGSGMLAMEEKAALMARSVKSESIKDINEVVPMSEGIAQHCKS